MPGADADGQLKNLDLLRAVAVGFVVVSHLVPALRGAPAAGSYDWRELGGLGVVLFFVHTCLVLMMSLQRQREQHGGGGFARRFFVRRLFRIYPLSALVVALSYGLAPLGLAPPAKASAAGVLANLLLVQNLTETPSVPAALWTLPYEVQMYLLLPGLFLLVAPDRKKGLALLGALWLLSAALGLEIALLGADASLIRFVPCFLPGVLAWRLTPASRTWPAWLLPACLLLLACGLPGLIARTGIPIMLTWPACLALGLLLPKLRELSGARAAAVARQIATYSYGIYLTHGWAVWLATEKLQALHPALQCLVFTLSASLLAFLAYRLVEAPGIRLGKRLAG